MPSKGVDFYAYLSGTQFQVNYSSPAEQNSFHTPPTEYDQNYHKNLQISWSDLGWFDFTGLFQWTAQQVGTGGSDIFNGKAEISPITGNLWSTNLGNMMDTPSQFGTGYALSYGFYDAGTGTTGLTDQDQSYVYLTDDHRNWMGTLVGPPGSATRQKPFYQFALPGAHDAGMMNTSCVKDMLLVPKAVLAFGPLFGNTFGIATALLTMNQIVRAIINVAFTQKDSITNMLNLGIRYFDYRPGKLPPVLNWVNSKLYHQHLFISGYGCEDFLVEVLKWLKGNPSEIVVVSNNFQGFLSDDMKPTEADLLNILNDSLQTSGTQSLIVAGDKSDLGASYDTLLTNKKRLIFLNQIGASNDAKKYDSYDLYPDAYNTVAVGTILEALPQMTTEGQNTPGMNYAYTVLQLQGTTTRLGGGWFTSIVTLSDASSTLMSTKAQFDNGTYPWLMGYAAKLKAPQPIVFLNDFADNALVSTAIYVTKQRMGIPVGP